MEVCVKKFVPQIQDEDVDIHTSLFIFVQIVAENVNTKKLQINYLKRNDSECVFDGIRDLLETVSIEVDLVPMDLSDFYGFTMRHEPPHLVYIDDLLEDYAATQALINTVPPTTFIINRGEGQKRFNTDIHYPLYEFGKGKNKITIARWTIIELWRQIESRTKVFVVTVSSESDIENLRKSLKAATVYNQLMVVAQYPDAFGVKEMIAEYRTSKNYAFVVFTNSEVDEQTAKSRLKADLAFSILNEGIWGGEYYVPVVKNC